MTRLLIAIALISACSGKGKQPTTGSGSASEFKSKRVSVSWGFQQAGELTDVFLAMTDETGKQVSHPLGRYKGTCTTIIPAKEMGSLTGVACTTTGGGTELHAVFQQSDVIVMQMGTEAGKTPDPMARNEVKRVAVPVGAAIVAE
ncbi:MAG: hypothetical protein WKG01_14250 [Kofleriaceae bacterium]